MSKFEIGEIAKFIYKNPHGIGLRLQPYNGEECEIIDPLGSKVKHGYALYGVKFSDGEEAWVKEDHLQKKKPPQELGRWEDVEELTGWNPNKVNIHA